MGNTILNEETTFKEDYMRLRACVCVCVYTFEQPDIRSVTRPLQLNEIALMAMSDKATQWDTSTCSRSLIFLHSFCHHDQQRMRERCGMKCEQKNKMIMSRTWRKWIKKKTYLQDNTDAFVCLQLSISNDSKWNINRGNQWLFMELLF